MIAFIIGLALAFMLLKILGLAIKYGFKFFVNALIGALGLLFFNFFGSMFGVTVELTALNCFVAGFFGFPGIILLLLMNM